jgi:hypothetical protein
MTRRNRRSSNWSFGQQQLSSFSDMSRPATPIIIPRTPELTSPKKIHHEFNFELKPNCDRPISIQSYEYPVSLHGAPSQNELSPMFDTALPAFEWPKEPALSDLKLNPIDEVRTSSLTSLCGATRRELFDVLSSLHETGRVDSRL